MAGCSISFFPNTIRWLHHFRHSSTTVMHMRTTAHTIMNRSWLKLLMMTMKPLSSSPSRFSTGTLTLSNCTKAVAAAVEYDVLIGVVSTPSPRGISSTENPMRVRHPVTK